METFNLNPLEEERPALEIAGLGRRILALLIDALVLGVLGWLLELVLRLFGFSRMFDSRYGELLFSLLVGLAYFTYYDSEERGGSFGKQTFSLRVVDENDQPLTLRHSAWRAFLKEVLHLFPLFAIVPIFTKHRQGVHDLIAKTYVIKE